MEHLETLTVGVACGQCGGEVYMAACPTHYWAEMSECQACGLVVVIERCTDCETADAGQE